MDTGECLNVVRREGRQTVEWKIERFFDIREECERSSTFSFANEVWCLCVCLNGVKGDDSFGWVSLYLRKEKPKYATHISYTIGIKKPDGSVFKSKSLEGTFKYGLEFPKFIQRAELSQCKDAVAPEGILTVFCTMHQNDGEREDATCQTVSSDWLQKDRPKEAASQTTTSQGDKNLTHQFKDLFISCLPADVKIKIKDRVFPAHKGILSARSTVFAAMFAHEMVEKISGVVDISDDPNADPENFQDFLIFVYTGAMDHVSPLNAMGLYNIADKYDTEELKKSCVKCMTQNLSVDSICDVVHLATVHVESELLKTATEFFINNSSEVLTTRKWRDFLLDNPLIVNEIFIQLANNNVVKK